MEYENEKRYKIAMQGREKLEQDIEKLKKKPESIALSKVVEYVQNKNN